MSKQKRREPVGYMCPPKEHQFKKGTSGNPRGRPPKPVRAFTSRQLRKEILQVTDANLRMSTASGVKEMPTMEAVLKTLVAMAVQDKSLPAIRLLLELQRDAIHEHETEFANMFEFIDLVERQKVTNPDLPKGKDLIDQESRLNRLRERTRRL